MPHPHTSINSNSYSKKGFFRAKSTLWIGLIIILAPALLGAFCNFGRVPPRRPIRIIPAGELSEEVVDDQLVVLPFITLTPTHSPTASPTFTLTPTPTLTPTTESEAIGVAAEPNATDGSVPREEEATDSTATVAPLPLTATPLPTATSLPTATPLPTSTPSPIPDNSDDDDDDDGGNNINPPDTATPTATSTPTATPTSAPVTVSLAATSSTVSEAIAVAAISVNLSAASNDTITVDYGTSNGTAFVGFDYLASNGTLTFTPGETTKAFNVTIIDDTNDDPDTEDINLTLSNVSNANLGTSSATLTITDNDSEPTIIFDSLTYTTVESNTTQIFTVTLSHSSGKVVSVTYGPNGTGTATSGVDYNPLSFGVLAFGPQATGESVITNTISWSGIINDGPSGEPNETVEIALSSPTNLILGSPPTTTLTIID